ncbi:tetratricopeptide repeat protein [Bacteroides fragilis]|uniref:tetratricopeptide repeat protein n=1 Tax=Bacteroides fragilis TaxID=817 RepID=UPI0022AA78DD|nr:tetratricopeptide repeat protein [Bacteroides fragilis]MCZ2616116.1 tetratricopeptide repeat protein [Bacteroides fragilis]MCZ2623792.1 tetratricopeptide repeat protein [Bacteroides fragilis]
MSKTFVGFIFLLSLVSGVVSCQRSSSPYPYSLRYADSLMEISPERTLAYLRKLDVSTYSAGDRAYFSLLLTQATDKNFLPLLPCDSLIDAALDYYAKKDGINWAKAWLYKGRIQKQMKMTEQALKSYFTALQGVEGNTEEELKLKGMLYEDMGSIYLHQSLYQKAFDAFYRSYQCDSLLNDHKVLIYSLSNMGWVRVVEGKEKEALFYLDQALELALALKDSVFMSNIYQRMSLNCENVDSAFMYARLAENYLTEKNDSISYYSLWLTFGELYLDKQELDSAEYYLKRTLDIADFKRKILASYSLAEVEKIRGNYQRAFEYQSYYGDNIDSIFSLNKASDIERLAYKYDSEAKVAKEKERHRLLVQQLCYGGVLFVLVIAIIFQRIYRRRRIAQLLYEQRIAHLNEQTALSQLQIERLEAQISALKQSDMEREQEIALKQAELCRVIDEKARLRNCLFAETSIFKRIQELSSQAKPGQDGVKRDPKVLLIKEQEQLKGVLFDIYDDYIRYLKDTYPKITDDDCIYCCLKLCEFDDQTIAYCFGNVSRQIVAQRRLRLKKKMVETN